MTQDDSPVSSRSEITQILESIGHSTAGADAGRARDRLFTLVYDELRKMAAGLMRGERADHTLRPTALVHEAYLRLVGNIDGPWGGRAHFFGAAARAMRQVLVDHAREHAALKRGGGLHRVTLDESLGPSSSVEFEILAVDEAITRLSRLDARTARVAELRIFAGLLMDEIASVIGVSKRTVEADWSFALKWLGRALE